MIRRAGAIAVAILLLLAAVPVGVWLRHWTSARAEPCRLTVFMLHGVTGDGGTPERYVMRRSVLAAQLDELVRLGATTRPVDSLVEAARQTGPEQCGFRPREFLLTFDMDGRSEQVENALPELVARSLTATFFVPTAIIDRPRAVSSLGIQALARAGMSIGSHSERHRDFRFMNGDSLIASLARTRNILEQLAGQPVRTVAAPGGRYDDRTVGLAARAGLPTLFTSDPCYVTPASAARGTWCRIEIRGDGGMSLADAMESPARVALQATAWTLKRAVERLIGPARWARLRHADL
jgi:peptidoglycan/xylan/chitin deacetylase (PgdA/CDA1 family)